MQHRVKRVGDERPVDEHDRLSASGHLVLQRHSIEHGCFHRASDHGLRELSAPVTKSRFLWAVVGAVSESTAAQSIIRVIVNWQSRLRIQ
jgi:hypothetical protein